MFRPCHDVTVGDAIRFPGCLRPLQCRERSTEGVQRSLQISNDTSKSRDLRIGLAAMSIMALLMWQFPTTEGLGPELIFALLPLALGLAWFRPAEVALLFVAATMFRIHEAYPFLMQYRIPLVTAGLCILSVALHLVRGSMQLPWRREIKLALLFALHVTVGMAFSVDRDQSWKDFTDNFSKVIAGMVFLAMILRLPRDALKISAVLMIASTLVSFVAIYNHIYGLNLIEGTRVTISRDIGSLLGDPNDLCFVLMFPLAFGISAVLTKDVSTQIKLVCIASLPFILWAIIATKSRGGVIATMVVLGYLYARARNARILPFLIAGVVGVALYVIAGVGQRAYVWTDTTSIDMSSLGRIEAWKAAVKMAFVYPIFGVGMGNFTTLFFFYTDYWDGRIYTTHSMWFQVLSETGWPGIALFGSMIVVSFRSARRTQQIFDDNLKAPAQVRALARSIVASWMGLAVAGSFLSQAYSWQVFTLVALTAVVGQYADQTYGAASQSPARSSPTPAGAAT